MNINIQFQLCGLLILILLIIFYKSHRTLQLYKEKVFYIAMCIITISLVMGILSLIFIYYRASLPGFWVDMVCKSYIITLIWAACIALMYVVQMPVSIIKIDYDLSKSFFKSLRAKHVVRAIISMAHDMNLKVVAEGIETEEEAAGMQQEGVDYIQGFYYSKPLPLPEYIKFIDEQFMH